MSARVAPLPQLDVITRVKLALMAGLDRLIMEDYQGYPRAAERLGVNLRHLYRIRYRDCTNVSLVWLVDAADRLGAEVVVEIRSPSSEGV